MEFIERMKVKWFCLRRGHRFLIDEYDANGAISATQCIHCGKRMTVKALNV